MWSPCQQGRSQNVTAIDVHFSHVPCYIHPCDIWRELGMQ